MNFLFTLLIISSCLAAQAGPVKTQFSDYLGSKSYFSYDEDQFLEKSNRRKNHSGDYLDYVIDYAPEDRKHKSETKRFFHDDDGHFYKLDKTAFVRRSSKKAALVNSNPGHALGNQRTLVVPVGDPSVSARSPLWTSEFLNRIFFSSQDTSVNTYYQEVSSNKVSFSGELAGLLVIDGLCEGGNIFNNGAADFLADLIDQQIDLSDFDRVAFVFPEDDFCLGGALGVGTLGNFTYTNPFGKPTRVSFNFNISAGVSANNSDYFLKVVTHEFGHNFGLKHDNGNACGEKIFEGECDSLEYGGVHSIMGYSPNLAHVNAIQQHDLEWLTDNQVAIIDEESFSGEFTIKALAAKNDNAFKAVKVKRDDGSFYTIEYRRPVRMDSVYYSTRVLSYGGLQIYLNNDDHERDSVLIRKDFKVFHPQDASEAGAMLQQSSFTPGETFFDPISDISIIPLSVDTKEATFLVQKAVAGAGTASVSLLHTALESYPLNSSGVTQTNLEIVLDGDAVSNSIMKISIPKASRKFIKIKKKKRKADIVNNSASFDAKFAPSIRFARKNNKNASGQYSVDLNVKIIDKATKKVTKEQVVSVLLAT